MRPTVDSQKSKLATKKLNKTGERDMSEKIISRNNCRILRLDSKGLRFFNFSTPIRRCRWYIILSVQFSATRQMH